MTLSRLRPKLLLAMASLAPMAAPTPAAADFFFRPFGYAFHQPIPEPAPNATPRAVAGILGEEGFRLVGGLGRRGDQVVATGVDRRGHYRRFLIDPFEGEILRSWRIGPEEVGPGFVEAPPAAYRGPPGPEPYDAPRAGAAEDPLVVPGLGGGEPRRPARRVEAPSRAHAPNGVAAVRPANAETQRPPHSPPSEATKPPTRAAAPQLRPTAPHSAKPAAERKAPAQQQSGPTPPQGAAPAPTPAPAAAPAAPVQAAPEPPHAAAPEPAAVGHQQAAPAPQTIVPATPAAPPPAPAAPANPVSAEQSKAPPAGEQAQPTPGG